MTVITPINVADITKAVVDQLRNDTRLAGTAVTRSEDENIDPNSCPWIGVYRLAVRYPQRQLVSAAGFRGQHVQLLILITQADQGSGEACEDALEELVQNTLSSLLSDTTLQGMVQFLDEFEVDYTRYTRSGHHYMQTAAIQFTAITNTTIGG